MMPYQNARDLTPQKLTEILHSQSKNKDWFVTNVQAEQWATEGTSSRLYKLSVSYSSDQLQQPKSFILKLSLPGVHAEMAQREVAYYKLANSMGAGKFSPRCYHCEYDAGTGHHHILMADLSHSHFHPMWPLPPRKVHCEAAVMALAQFHAFWWGHIDLERVYEQAMTRAKLDALVDQHQKMFKKFSGFMGDRLEQGQAAYEALFKGFTNLWEQHESRQPSGSGALTLVHGDSSFSNLLIPNNLDKGNVAIIDLQTSRVGVGTDDLAEMMALYWPPDVRNRLEKHLVELYFQTLKDNGVANYDWENCWLDYRTSAVKTPLAPLSLYSAGKTAHDWWYPLVFSLAAFDDLECLPLLESHFA